LLEFIKNFIKKLFGKDQKLIKEVEEPSQEEVIENNQVQEEKDNPNADLPPVTDDTDPFEYMNNIIKESPSYNNYLKTVKEYNATKEEYKNVIEEVKKAQK